MTLAPSGAGARPVLAVSGLAREARVAAGPRIETIQAGGDTARLKERLAVRKDAALCAVVSFGIAGGLDPALSPGDIVIGAGVIADRRFSSDRAIVELYAERLAALGPRVVVADLAGVDSAVMTVAAKSALRAATGASAVDMESHVAAAFAQEHGFAFAALRVVCDPAERALPPFAATALKPNGDPDILAVLAALLRREARIGELIRLARDSRAAFASLSRARALLGLALGVDA